MTGQLSRIAETMHTHQESLMQQWADQQYALARSARSSRVEIESEGRQFLTRMIAAARNDTPVDLNAPAWEPVRELLNELSETRAKRGLSAQETAAFVFGLKKPLFAALRQDSGGDAQKLADDVLASSDMLDTLGLFTFEAFQKSREAIISRQQQELMELSTPVVRL